MVKKNNTYLKDIADTVGGDAEGVHTDNYYLKQISENISGSGDITVDSELSTTSENPVQNKVITNALNDKADESALSTVAKTGNYDDLSNKPVLDFVKVTTDKGTASASTMDKLFIEVGANKTDAYYTVENNGTYSWKKFDEDILDDLSISWNDITNKPNLFSGNYNDLSNKPTLFSGDYDDLTNKPVIPSVTVIEDISEITGNGLYILKESEPPLPQLKLVFNDGADYGYSSLSITTDQSDTENIYLADGETLTVDWGDGNVVTYSNTDTLPQEYSFTTTGEHTVIFDFTDCSIPTLGEYTFESCASNITEVYYPYGATKIFDMGLEYSYLTLVDIPSTVSEFDGDLGTTDDGFVDVYWTDANDIASLSYIVYEQQVRIPNGTTAIYEANSDWNNNGNTVFIERGA